MNSLKKVLSMCKILRKYRSFVKISPQREKLFLMVIVLSLYRKYLFMIKSPSAYVEKISKIPFAQEKPTPEQLLLAVDISYAIKLYSKYIPWENACRHHSWQAAWLLRHHGIPFKFYIGMRKNTNCDIEGHSWIKVDEFFVCGECNTAEYQIISTEQI